MLSLGPNLQDLDISVFLEGLKKQVAGRLAYTKTSFSQVLPFLALFLPLGPKGAQVTPEGHF